MNTISKSPREEFPIVFGFSTDMAPGEVIDHITLTCVNEATGSNSAVEIIKTSSIAGYDATVVLQAGVENDEHAIQCIAVTTTGNQYDRDVKLRIEIVVDDSFNKQPSDSFMFDVDYRRRFVSSNETVTEAVVEALDESTGASVYGTVVLAPSILTPKIGVPVEGGTVGKPYRIGILGTTSYTYKHEKFIRMNMAEF